VPATNKNPPDLWVNPARSVIIFFIIFLIFVFFLFFYFFPSASGVPVGLAVDVWASHSATTRYPTSSPSSRCASSGLGRLQGSIWGGQRRLRGLTGAGRGLDQTGRNTTSPIRCIAPDGAFYTEEVGQQPARTPPIWENQQPPAVGSPTMTRGAEILERPAPRSRDGGGLALGSRR